MSQCVIYYTTLQQIVNYISINIKIAKATIANNLSILKAPFLLNEELMIDA